MENITVTLTPDQLQIAVQESIKKILSDSYSNPVRDAVVDAIKQQDGPIQKIVGEIIAESLSNPDFKKHLGEVVMAKMVESVLKK